MRLLADDKGFVVGDVHHEAHVVVPVRRHALVLGDPVAVEVEDLRFHRQPRQPGFLLRFDQCNAGEIGLAIRVAAELQPHPQLAVVRQQRRGGHRAPPTRPKQ